MTLEHLWAGWRFQYVSEAAKAERSGDEDECVFCRLAASGPPTVDNGVVWRGELTFAVLNAFPYASGHLLVMPARHVAELEQLTEDESTELWRAMRQAVVAITTAYDPDALNMGANLGRAAGAGIPGHVHLHVLPRWAGDTNFMTSVGGVRVLSEWLADAWKRLQPAWPTA